MGHLGSRVRLVGVGRADAHGLPARQARGGRLRPLEREERLPLWQDTFAAWGLAWFSALAVGSITLLLSVVFRSAAAAMGTMMATLVGGTILSRVASDWDGAKWFFVTNLPLPDFYAGMPDAVRGDDARVLGVGPPRLGGRGARGRVPPLHAARRDGVARLEWRLR